MFEHLNIEKNSFNFRKDYINIQNKIYVLDKLFLLHDNRIKYGRCQSVDNFMMLTVSIESITEFFTTTKKVILDFLHEIKMFFRKIWNFFFNKEEKIEKKANEVKSQSSIFKEAENKGLQVEALPLKKKAIDVNDKNIILCVKIESPDIIDKRNEFLNLMLNYFTSYTDIKRKLNPTDGFEALNSLKERTEEMYSKHEYLLNQHFEAGTLESVGWNHTVIDEFAKSMTKAKKIYKIIKSIDETIEQTENSIKNSKSAKIIESAEDDELEESKKVFQFFKDLVAFSNKLVTAIKKIMDLNEHTLLELNKSGIYFKMKLGRLRVVEQDKST
jgi:hypothetical protein